VCTLLNGDIVGDRNPKTTSIYTFCIAFHIFVVDKHRDFKFGVKVDHMNEGQLKSFAIQYDRLNVKNSSYHKCYLNT